MRVPLSWLKEFVDVAAEPARLAEDLTLAGLEVGALETDGGDTILDLDVTTNRVDCMNVYGVAREVSVLYDLPLRPLPTGFEERGAPASESVAVEIEAPELCPRFTARVLDAKAGPSPSWLRDRLDQVGVRPLQNIVDLTNYVMMEMGQPSHAFDAGLLESGRLIVRWARDGERLTTLDGIERELASAVGVVADPSGAQGLAGVMGGAAAEVTDETRLVVLEAAYWDPLSIRRAARRLGIHTEASHRFERGADPQGTLLAQSRIAHLLQKLGAGSARPGLVDVHPAPAPERVVTLRAARVSRLLGAEIPESESRRVLVGLGFGEHGGGDGAARYRVPSWRGDVSREADLIEEVGRHHGLGTIPSTLPPARNLVGLRPYQVRDRELRAYLTAAGLNEVINYSFVAPSDAGGEQVGLENPLSAEEGRLRRSLVPGLVANLAANLRQGRRDLGLYELGRVFAPGASADRPAEPKRLAVLVAGNATPRHWSAPSRASDFFDLKGLLEGLFARVGLAPPTLAAEGVPGFLHPGRSAAVDWRGRPIGAIGALHPRLAESWELKDETLVMEIDLDPLLETPVDAVRSQPLPRFPAVERELSLLCPSGLPSARLVEAAQAAGGALLGTVAVVDRYDRPPVPPGKVSLSLGLRYQARERTLTGDEVQASVEAVMERLRAAGAEIRGSD